MPSSKLSHDRPPPGRFAYWAGRFWMWLSGWKIAGSAPAENKFVLIAAPHTSNWDLVFMLATTHILGIRVSWIGKHSLFKAPFGPIMRWLGGIPVNRESPQGLVAQIAELYDATERLIIAIPPSGTRKNQQYWKSGFYWIAKTAQVPVVCGFLDYGKKEAGFGISFIPTGNVKQDMDKVRAFYKDIRGKNHEMFPEFKLKEEDGPDTSKS